MTMQRTLFATAIGFAAVMIASASPGWAASPGVTLCHKGEKTLTLQPSVADRHVAQHGDTLGPCGCGPCISTEDCPAGTVCNANQLCLLWCECPECDVCAGLCVPADCGECTSNADCPPGTTCNAADICLVSCSCPLCAVCAGHCVP